MQKRDTVQKRLRRSTARAAQLTAAGDTAGAAAAQARADAATDELARLSHTSTACETTTEALTQFADGSSPTTALADFAATTPARSTEAMREANDAVDEITREWANTTDPAESKRLAEQHAAAVKRSKAEREAHQGDLLDEARATMGLPDDTDVYLATSPTTGLSVMRVGMDGKKLRASDRARGAGLFDSPADGAELPLEAVDNPDVLGQADTLRVVTNGRQSLTMIELGDGHAAIDRTDPDHPRAIWLGRRGGQWEADTVATWETTTATPQPAKVSQPDPNIAADHVRAVVLGRSRTPAVEVPVTEELAEARADLADQVKKVKRIEASHKASAAAFRHRARGDASREHVAQKARRAELATEKDELGRAEMWVPYYRRRADELEEAHRVERAKEAGARYRAEAGLPADWDVRARVYVSGAAEVETSRPVNISETRVPELEAYDTGDLVPVADLDLAALQTHAKSTATLTTSSGRQLQRMQFASGELIVETSDGEQTAAWVSGADRGHPMWGEVQDGLRTGGDVPHLADLAAHERMATAERKAKTA